MLVKVKDKYFKPLIEPETINARVSELGTQINRDYKDLNPLFVAVLNGSFIFAADLFRHMETPAEISFIKFSSYRKTQSSGSVSKLIGFPEEVRDRHIVIVEDIVDTGLTMSEILNELSSLQPRSVEIATLLLKPSALQEEIEIKYIGFEIDNRFVVGYGLDYDGYGRNLSGLYEISEQN